MKVESQIVTYYHGTSKQFEKSICTHGLRKGSFIALEKFVASGFATSMFPDEKIAIIAVNLPSNLIVDYLDTDVDSTAEVIKTIPPQFLRPLSKIESQTRHLLDEIAIIPS
jgi:hypothetical protein